MLDIIANNIVDIDSDADTDTDTDLSENDSIVSTGKYNLVLCELHQTQIHGFDANESDPNIFGHYLIISKLNPYDREKFQIIIEMYKRKYLYLVSSLHLNNHPFIRNNYSIVSNNKYIQPQIDECIYLQGDESVAIIKTIWIKIIQRVWKKIYTKRMYVQNIRRHPNNIHYWNINGKWSESCNYLPSIFGMLSNLSRGCRRIPTTFIESIRMSITSRG